MPVRLSVTHTPYATSLREQIGYIITFAKFEEGDLLYDNSNDDKLVTNPMTIQ